MEETHSNIGRHDNEHRKIKSLNTQRVNEESRNTEHSWERSNITTREEGCETVKQETVNIRYTRRHGLTEQGEQMEQEKRLADK